MSLAYHNLLQDKVRSTLSILGVGLTIMLILVLNSFLIGVDRAASTYLDRSSAEREETVGRSRRQRLLDGFSPKGLHW